MHAPPVLAGGGRAGGHLDHLPLPRQRVRHPHRRGDQPSGPAPRAELRDEGGRRPDPDLDLRGSSSSSERRLSRSGHPTAIRGAPTRSPDAPPPMRGATLAPRNAIAPPMV